MPTQCHYFIRQKSPMIFTFFQIHLPFPTSDIPRLVCVTPLSQHLLACIPSQCYNVYYNVVEVFMFSVHYSILYDIVLISSTLFIYISNFFRLLWRDFEMLRLQYMISRCVRRAISGNSNEIYDLYTLLLVKKTCYQYIVTKNLNSEYWWTCVGAEHTPATRSVLPQQPDGPRHQIKTKKTILR